MTNAATPLVTFNAMPAKFDTYRDFFLWESKASEEVLENAFAFEGTKAVMVSEMEPAIKNFIIGIQKINFIIYQIRFERYKIYLKFNLNLKGFEY